MFYSFLSKKIKLLLFASIDFMKVTLYNEEKLKRGTAMGVYESFAYIYDKFMEVDYAVWLKYIKELWNRFDFHPSLLLDLGCGTGEMTGRMAEEGLDMIGVDISADMLAVARQKAEEKELDILYLEQDMRSFELYGTVDGVICLCDSLNYITEEEELLQVFRLVNNYLNPSGLFIFDLNTEYKFQHMLGDNTFAEAGEDAAYIWENTYDEIGKINEYYMNFFLKTPEGRYERTEECHYERAYDLDFIRSLIEKSGMKFLAAYDAFTFHPPREDSERIYVVAKEIQKVKASN